MPSGEVKSVIPLENGIQFKENGMDPVFTGVTIRLGFRRNDGWRVPFQATK